MGNEQFKDSLEQFEEGQKLKVETYSAHHMGGFGALTNTDSVTVFREFGKRALKLRQVAGRDLGAAIKPFHIYMDKQPFRISSLYGLQDMGDGVVLCEELDVSNNEIADITVSQTTKKQGTFRVNLLEKFSGLKKLWMAKNNFSLAEFKPSMASLKLLDLSKCRKLKMLTIDLPKLKYLDVSGCALPCIPDLTSCPNLRVLLMKDNPTSGRSIERLVHCQKLEILDLQNNKITWKFRAPELTLLEKRLHNKMMQKNAKKRGVPWEAPKLTNEQRRDREVEAFKDPFRRFLSVLQALPIIHRITLIQNPVENELFFQWFLQENGPTLEILNLGTLDSQVTERPLKDKEWDPEDYFVIPGERLLEIMAKKLHDSTVDKQINAYRKQVEADLRESVAEVEGEPGSPKSSAPKKEAPSPADEDDPDLIPKYPLGGGLFRNDQAMQLEMVANNHRQFSPIKVNDLLFMVVNWSFTQPDVQIFQHAVYRMITHPVRPRALLRGEMNPEDAINEFLAAAVLQIQNLYSSTTEPPPIDGMLNPDGTRDAPPAMMKPMECYRVVLNALVDLVCIPELNMGPKVAEALFNMARGRARRIALDIVPLAMERLQYYSLYEVRTNNGIDEFVKDGGWNTPQIVNYLMMITDIFKAVPETKALSGNLSKVFVLWFKDPATLGVHMIHIRNLVDPRPRSQWEKAFDSCDWEKLFWMTDRQLKKYNLQVEDDEANAEADDDEEDDEPIQRPIQRNPIVRITQLASAERINVRWLQIMLALNLDEVYHLSTDGVPSRLASLLRDSGLFSRTDFWMKWMNKWLEGNGIRGRGRAPKSIVIMLSIVAKLVLHRTELSSQFGNLYHWITFQMSQFVKLAEKYPEKIRQNGPRSGLACQLLRCSACFCCTPKMLQEELIAPEARMRSMLSRLWHAVYAVGKDGMLIDAILKSCGMLVMRCNRLELDAEQGRFEELFEKQVQPGCSPEVVSINTVHLHQGPGTRWDNLRYELDELSEDQDQLLVFYSPKSNPDWQVVLGHKVHVLSHNPNCTTEHDALIRIACVARWIVVKLVFAMDDAQSGNENGSKEVDAADKAEAMLAREFQDTSSAGLKDCTFRPVIDSIYNLLCSNSEIYQAIHISAHDSELLKNNARLQLAAAAFEQHGDSRSAKQLSHAKNRALELMDAEIPDLATQDYAVMQGLFSSAIQFISLIFNTSTTHHDMLGVAGAFSPWCEIVRIMRLPHGGDPNFRNAHIENILFSLVRNPHDDVKIGAIMCLSHMRSEKFEPEAIEQMVNLLSNCANASSGQMEDVLVGVVRTLLQIADVPGPVGQQFREEHGREIVRGCLQILKQMAMPDPLDLSLAEIGEKERLCSACLMLLVRSEVWRDQEGEPICQTELSKPVAAREVNEILRLDQLHNSVKHPVQIEQTMALGDVESCLMYLNETRAATKSSYITTRILRRMSSLLEGTAVARSKLDLLAAEGMEEFTRRDEQYSAMKKDGWFSEHKYDANFHQSIYFCEPTVQKKSEQMKDPRVVLDSELFVAGPFKSVDEGPDSQRQRENMYEEFDELNTHTELVNKLFEYALGDAGGAGDEDPGTEVADKTFADKHQHRNGLPYAINLWVIHNLAVRDIEPDHSLPSLFQGIQMHPRMSYEVEQLYKMLKKYQEYLNTRRGESFAANALESPWHLAIPAKMPNGIAALEYRSSGLRKETRPVSIMMPPLQCPLQVKGEKTWCLHTDGVDPECTCFKNSTLAAAIRALKAIATYGTPESCKQLWNKLAEPQEFAAVCCIPYQSGWFQFNMGASVVDLLHQFLCESNVRRKGVDHLEKNPGTFLHYATVMLMVRDALRELRIPMLVDLSTISGVYRPGSGVLSAKSRSLYSFREHTWQQSIFSQIAESSSPPSAKRSKSMLLAPRQEQLLLQTVRLYILLVDQFYRVEFEWDPPNFRDDGQESDPETPANGEDEEDSQMTDLSEEEEEQLALEKLVLQAKQRRKIFKRVFPLSSLYCLVQFLFYNLRISFSCVCLNQESIYRRAQIYSKVMQILGTMANCHDPHHRDEVVALIYYMEHKEGLLLPESVPVSYTHLRAHETVLDLVCRLLLEKKKNKP
eukprot:TRINITY_DN6705_c0_g1_i3.p1 TRINITY_DN6705_c0_g1~~TRINITY_DN6705_c0_g1_i3.p1  ORF type:complete len:2087 (+),score=541.59 TRINITY_DN6705_c0_g1_i3:135-6395(+)